MFSHIMIEIQTIVVNSQKVLVGEQLRNSQAVKAA